MTHLRDYQQNDIERLRAAVGRGSRSPLYQLPTGGGKTAVAGDLIRRAREKEHHVLFLAPRRELVYQACQRLDSLDLDHGIIMAGEDPTVMPSIQVASIPTLHARAVQRYRIAFPPADLVVVDEAHIGVGGRAQEIIDSYREASSVVVGLTATPARTDGRGLGAIYDELVQGPSIPELVQQGWLAPARYFSGRKPDMSGVKIQGGDYNKRQSGARVNDIELVGDVVSNWLRLASDRPTFVYAVTRAHSRHLCDRFIEAGVAAEHIDSMTDLDERKAIQQRLRDGVTQVLCNCEILTYGVDFPPVSCLVVARPTKSIARYLQMVGRGLRPFDGKADCLVLDHAGVIEDVGFVDDPVPWSLDGKTRVQDRKSQSSKPIDIACPECDAVFRPRKYCPHCGLDLSSQYKQAIAAQEAQLAEVDRKTRKKRDQLVTREQRRAFFRELVGYAREKGKKRGWAAHAYRFRFGGFPSGFYHDPPLKPSRLTRSWVTHYNIVRAKSRDKGRRQHEEVNA